VTKSFGTARQRRLWENLVVNPLPAVKTAMNEAARASNLSREQLAEDMNRLAHLAGMRGRFSRAVLDKILNENAEGYQPGLAALFLFCQAVGDSRPLQVFIRAFPGAHLVDDEDRRLLEWARTERAARQARRQARKLAPGAGVE